MIINSKPLRLGFLFSILTLSTSLFAEIYMDSFESDLPLEARWQLDKKAECVIERSETRSRAGATGLLFSAGPNARCEIVPKMYSNWLSAQMREPFGEDRWYAFSVFLEEPWGVVSENEVIAQWHSSKDWFFGDKSGRGPPLALRILGSNWRVTYGWDADLASEPGPKAIYPLWVGPYQTGVWTDWVFQVRWSHENDGRLRIWKDGELLVDHSGPNAYNDIRGVYIKMGSYHPAIPRRLYLDEIRIGDSSESYETVRPNGDK